MNEFDEDNDKQGDLSDLDNDTTKETTEAAAVDGKIVLPSGTMVMCDDGIERPVITREAALADGLNRYFPGLECANGHMAERKCKGYVCTTCARNRQKARKKVRASEDPAFKAKLTKKRAEKHALRYKQDEDYRRRVLDRAKARRAKASAERQSLKDRAEAEIKGGEVTPA